MLSSYSYDELLSELQRRNGNPYSKIPEETNLESAQRRFLRGEEQITKFGIFIDEMKSKGFDTSESESTMRILQSSVDVLRRNLIQEQEKMVQAHRLASMRGSFGKLFEFVK